MDPISAILGAASLFGGILNGAGGRKAIDPNWLKQHFGAGAVTEEFQNLFNTLINSPMGQQMMTSAAEQGQQFARSMSEKAAAAGLGPSGGADSGSSIFATSAAEGASGALRRGVQSDIAAQALPIAQQLVQNRMNAAVQSQLIQQQQPTSLQNIGGAIGNAAGLGLMARQAELDRQKTTTPPPAPAPLQGTMPGGGTLPYGPQVQVPQAQLHPPGRGIFSRVGRGLGRYAARFGNFVTPGNPFGSPT